LSLNISFCLSFANKYLSYKKSCSFNKTKLTPLIAHSVPFSATCSNILPVSSIANGLIQTIKASTHIPLAPISPSLGRISFSKWSMACFSWSSVSSWLSSLDKEILFTHLLTNNLLKARSQISALAFQT